MRDLGLLVLRLLPGGLLIGHGAQKLFGWFGGYGLQGTAGWLESVQLRPGKPWALLAGLGEFVGGLLTALGLFHPIGPIVTLAPMSVAANTVHAGKPIWVAEGGGELPTTYMAVGIGLALTGPGRYSMDRLLGIKVPPLLVALAGAGVVVGTAVAVSSWSAAKKKTEEAPAEESTEEAGEELQGDKGMAA